MGSDAAVNVMRQIRPAFEGANLVPRSAVLEMLQNLDPSVTTGMAEQMLAAAGFPEGELVEGEGFFEWLFRETPRKKPALAALQTREVPDVSVLDDGTVVEFITDVEGNWDYFLHFVSLSEVLFWEGDERGAWGPGTLMLRDGGMFVFGGDAPDKGPGDIRFVQTLLSLKQRYWSRVFIVIGNRDINKLRFYAELAEGEDGTTFASRGGAYWEPLPPRFPDYERYLVERNLERGSVSTLRWMLDCNMGSCTAFSTRKTELALLHGKATDQDVLRSFRESVDPHGVNPWMLDLLRVGQIVVILGDALFVHGGLYDESMGRVPGSARTMTNAREWARALNDWKDQQIKDFELRPQWRQVDNEHRRGGGDLIDYGCINGGNGSTVVYHNPFNNGNPHQLSPAVEDFLSDSGIKRVFSGHQPHGESPTVVRHVRSGLLVVTCDTSFSNPEALKLFNKANNRGDVVTVVRLDRSMVQVEGVLKHGLEHSCTLHCNPTEDKVPDALVGRQLNDGSWVKTVVEDGKVLTALGKGFKVKVQAMHPRKACLLLKPQYMEPRFAVQLQQLTAEWLVEQSFLLEDCPAAGFDPLESRKSVQEYCTSAHFCRANFDSAETYVFDGNGTMWELQDPTRQRSPQQLEQVVVKNINDIIASGKRTIFVTNDSNYSRQMLVNRLLKQGIKLCADDPASKKEAEWKVVTPAFTCAWFLKKAMIKKPFILCSQTGLLDELQALGIQDYVATTDVEGTPREAYFKPVTADHISEIVKQHPDVDAIVVGWDQQLTALKIAVAAAYLKWSREAAADGSHHRPMQIITCSSDNRGVLGITRTDFCAERGWTNRSVPAVGNGTMASSICACVSSDQRAIDVGKPSEILMEALRRPVEDNGYGVDFKTAVVIGDTLETDVQLANRSGMRSLLVLSGVTGRSDLLQVEDPAHIPTWVVDSFADI